MQPSDPPRVAITGMGITCPIGNDLDSVVEGLKHKRSAVRIMPQWAEVNGLGVGLAALVDGVDFLEVIPRKFRRTMGRVAQLAAFASRRAVEHSKLPVSVLSSSRTGLAIGSTTGSAQSIFEAIANALGPDGFRSNKATTFLKTMSHTCAANVALTLGITGRVWSPNSACTSGSQSIGLGYESIRAGLCDVMICGGAEEVHYSTAATFELAGAASKKYNAHPEITPKPFDKDRDGLVVGEGAGILVLERWEHAVARGAQILGELIGFSTNCDAEHMTSPSSESMERCMAQALESAQIKAAEIGYINAHATGTELGDEAEAAATRRLFGERPYVSSTKGNIGHTLGACGGIESIFVLLMMRDGFLDPTLNLKNIDPNCAGLFHMTDVVDGSPSLMMNNNFAFGGINTSLIFQRAV